MEGKGLDVDWGFVDDDTRTAFCEDVEGAADVLAGMNAGAFTVAASGMEIGGSSGAVSCVADVGTAMFVNHWYGDYVWK